MTLADAALIAMQWIHEAQDGRTGSRGADNPSGADPDDRVPAGAVPDGAMMTCPRCGNDVEFQPTGEFVAFCVHCLAFLLPDEVLDEDDDADDEPLPE